MHRPKKKEQQPVEEIELTVMQTSRQPETRVTVSEALASGGRRIVQREILRTGTIRKKDIFLLKLLKKVGLSIDSGVTNGFNNFLERSLITDKHKLNVSLLGGDLRTVYPEYIREQEFDKIKEIIKLCSMLSDIALGTEETTLVGHLVKLEMLFENFKASHSKDLKTTVGKPLVEIRIPAIQLLDADKFQSIDIDKAVAKYQSYFQGLLLPQRAEVVVVPPHSSSVSQPVPVLSKSVPVSVPPQEPVLGSVLVPQQPIIDEQQEQRLQDEELDQPEESEVIVGHLQSTLVPPPSPKKHSISITPSPSVVSPSSSAVTSPIIQTSGQHKTGTETGVIMPEAVVQEIGGQGVRRNPLAMTGRKQQIKFSDIAPLFDLSEKSEVTVGFNHFLNEILINPHNGSFNVDLLAGNLESVVAVGITEEEFEKIKQIVGYCAVLYCQNVLKKDPGESLDTLKKLFDELKIKKQKDLDITAGKKPVKIEFPDIILRDAGSMSIFNLARITQEYPRYFRRGSIQEDKPLLSRHLLRPQKAVEGGSVPVQSKVVSQRAPQKAKAVQMSLETPTVQHVKFVSAPPSPKEPVVASVPVLQQAIISESVQPKYAIKEFVKPPELHTVKVEKLPLGQHGEIVELQQPVEMPRLVPQRASEVVDPSPSTTKIVLASSPVLKQATLVPQPSPSVVPPPPSVGASVPPPIVVLPTPPTNVVPIPGKPIVALVAFAFGNPETGEKILLSCDLNGFSTGLTKNLDNNRHFQQAVRASQIFLAGGIRGVRFDGEHFNFTDSQGKEISEDSVGFVARMKVIFDTVVPRPGEPLKLVDHLLELLRSDLYRDRPFERAREEVFRRETGCTSFVVNEVVQGSDGVVDKRLTSGGDPTLPGSGTHSVLTEDKATKAKEVVSITNHIGSNEQSTVKVGDKGAVPLTPEDLKKYPVIVKEDYGDAEGACVLIDGQMMEAKGQEAKRQLDEIVATRTQETQHTQQIEAIKNPESIRQMVRSSPESVSIVNLTNVETLREVLEHALNARASADIVASLILSIEDRQEGQKPLQSSVVQERQEEVSSVLSTRLCEDSLTLRPGSLESTEISEGPSSSTSRVMPLTSVDSGNILGESSKARVEAPSSPPKQPAAETYGDVRRDVGSPKPNTLEVRPEPDNVETTSSIDKNNTVHESTRISEVHEVLPESVPGLEESLMSPSRIIESEEEKMTHVRRLAEMTPESVVSIVVK